MTDPFSGQQTRFYRTDPTGRINRLQEEEKMWGKIATLIILGSIIYIVILAAILWKIF